jgi:tRNA-splicing ligase RtcB (3'-phosphate/5'-hydroxy nucleic acid ligase)
MQHPKNLNRLLRALSRQGLDVSYSNKVYSISLNSSLKEHWQDDSATTAEVLLPEGFPVEAKALKQLANLANVRHPQGGCVCRTCATPDFHPGDAGVTIGSIFSRWFRFHEWRCQIGSLSPLCHILAQNIKAS